MTLIHYPTKRVGDALKGTPYSISTSCITRIIKGFDSIGREIVAGNITDLSDTGCRVTTTDEDLARILDEAGFYVVLF